MPLYGSTHKMSRILIQFFKVTSALGSSSNTKIAVIQNPSSCPLFAFLKSQNTRYISRYTGPKPLQVHLLHPLLHDRPLRCSVHGVGRDPYRHFRHPQNYRGRLHCSGQHPHRHCRGGGRHPHRKPEDAWQDARQSGGVSAPAGGEDQLARGFTKDGGLHAGLEARSGAVGSDDQLYGQFPW